MATAFLESPVQSSSQLFFAWSEADEALASPAAARPPVQASAVRQVAPRDAVDARGGSSEAPAQPAARHAQPAVARRGAGEVRLGAVMIKLLKRYGISDEEIAEGLANYAKKTCQSVAS